MTGLTPVSRVFCQSWTAPAIEPWSVRLTAGISSSAARLTRSGMRHAPSRIEYSEWTCRWTKDASDMPKAKISGASAGSVYRFLGNSLGADAALSRAMADPQGALEGALASILGEARAQVAAGREPNSDGLELRIASAARLAREGGADPA